MAPYKYGVHLGGNLKILSFRLAKIEFSLFSSVFFAPEKRYVPMCIFFKLRHSARNFNCSMYALCKKQYCSVTQWSFCDEQQQELPILVDWFRQPPDLCILTFNWHNWHGMNNEYSLYYRLYILIDWDKPVCAQPVYHIYWVLWTCFFSIRTCFFSIINCINCIYDIRALLVAIGGSWQL